MENKNEVFVTDNFRETQRLAVEFANKIIVEQRLFLAKKKACVIALYGDLGSGKTTFVQGLARGLGIERRIISPTFIIVRSYKIGVTNYELRIKNFYHVDLYRIKGDKDIEGLGIEEVINNPENIVVIEWAEKMGRLLPKKRWDVRFSHANENIRKIKIQNTQKDSDTPDKSEIQSI